jgi:thioredoxin-like negative regulator of GroEL
LNAAITYLFKKMTPEKKAALIRNGIILLLVIGIPAMVFAPWEKKPKKKDHKAAETIQTHVETEAGSAEITNLTSSSKLKDGQINEIIAEAARKRGGIVVGIIHCHAPGNPESEQMADILNNIARRYGQQVKVIRVDITAYPEFAKTEKVARPPKLILTAGSERASELQGLWPQPQVEQKVDEILRGLKRVSKDWLPEVKGMQPMSKSAPPTPAKPISP